MVIVHVYHVHIVCGYGMLTSSNRAKQSQTSFIYGYTSIHIINAIIALKDSCVSYIQFKFMCTRLLNPTDAGDGGADRGGSSRTTSTTTTTSTTSIPVLKFLIM